MPYSTCLASLQQTGKAGMFDLPDGPGIGGPGSRHDLALAELHHRIGNDLQAIGGLAEQAMKRCQDPAASAGLELIVRQVMAVSTLDGHLRPASPDRVDFVDYLTALGEKIAQTLPPEVCRFRLVLDPEPLGLGAVTASRLAIAVNERVAHAAQHAFPLGSPGVVTSVCSACSPAPWRSASPMTGAESGNLDPRGGASESPNASSTASAANSPGSTATPAPTPPHALTASARPG